eukprot:TRINITY_DN284_c1_g4_i1.p1 TRINITY_DN284_c1_g4~~TRINITY_DN284_c1_g4_i1.p1  ORF type:complete len:615 (-),score=198.96 TRINITY_DN284_c1_g4_i1:778-2403(-)
MTNKLQIFNERIQKIVSENEVVKKEQVKVAQENANMSQVLVQLKSQIQQCLLQLELSRKENDNLRQLLSAVYTAAAENAVRTQPGGAPIVVTSSSSNNKLPRTTAIARPVVSPPTVQRAALLHGSVSVPSLVPPAIAQPAKAASDASLKKESMKEEKEVKEDTMKEEKSAAATSIDVTITEDHDAASLEAPEDDKVTPEETPEITGESGANFDIGDLQFALDNLNALDFVPDVSSAPLVFECHATFDMNKSGLRKGHKKPMMLPDGTVAPLAMEDEHCCEYPLNNNPDRALFAVFDGFAGDAAAKSAKELVPKELYRLMDEAGDATDLTSVMFELFKNVDQQMKQHEDVGCTCTVVVVWSVNGKRYLQSANVGDSEAFLCRGGLAVALTEPHKVTMEKERRRIRDSKINMTAAQTRVNGVSVSRALGVHFVKDKQLGIIAEPYVSPVYELSAEDYAVVVCCDGVWDVMSGQDVFDLVFGGNRARTRDHAHPDDVGSVDDNFGALMGDAPKACASAMARRILSNAKHNPLCHDNLTVILALL